MLTQTALRTASFKPMAKQTVPPPAAHSLSGGIELMGAPMNFGRNAEIYGENEPADYLYKVISGTVRTYKVLTDGRRQIGAFYLPGDIFGLETGDEHTFSAEAVSDTKVLVIKRSAVVALAGRDGGVARELWALTARELRRVQDHILLLIQTAQERVASFLLEMAARGPRRQCGRADDVAPGHRRLPRPHDRDGLADAHQPGKCCHHRDAELAANRTAQSL